MYALSNWSLLLDGESEFSIYELGVTVRPQIGCGLVSRVFDCPFCRGKDCANKSKCFVIVATWSVAQKGAVTKCSRTARPGPARRGSAWAGSARLGPHFVTYRKVEQYMYVCNCNSKAQHDIGMQLGTCQSRLMHVRYLPSAVNAN